MTMVKMREWAPLGISHHQLPQISNNNNQQRPISQMPSASVIKAVHSTKCHRHHKHIIVNHLQILQHRQAHHQNPHLHNANQMRQSSNEPARPRTIYHQLPPLGKRASSKSPHRSQPPSNTSVQPTRPWNLSQTGRPQMTIKKKTSKMRR